MLAGFADALPNAAWVGNPVRGAIAAIDGEIAGLLTSRPWDNLADLDHALADLDGSTGYSRLGANAIVAASILAARAFAHTDERSLHDWIARQLRRVYDEALDEEIPSEMMAILAKLTAAAEDYA